MVSELFPILSTGDLPRALGFYRDLLGGTMTFEYPGPDGSPAYVGLTLGASHVGIGADPDREPQSGRPRIVLWAYVDDCDATMARLRSAGVRVIEEPADQPWGERTARVLDPDGNEVIIGQAANR